MTFPKKNTRTIIIDNEKFYWRIRKPLYEEVLIQHESNGGILDVYFVYCYTDDNPTITPSLIRKVIEIAIRRGWNFTEKGNVFKLEYLIPYTNKPSVKNDIQYELI